MTSMGSRLRRGRSGAPGGRVRARTRTGRWGRAARDGACAVPAPAPAQARSTGTRRPSGAGTSTAGRWSTTTTTTRTRTRTGMRRRQPWRVCVRRRWVVAPRICGCLLLKEPSRKRRRVSRHCHVADQGTHGRISSHICCWACARCVAVALTLEIRGATDRPQLAGAQSPPPAFTEGRRLRSHEGV
ncbi:hypothetical protein GGX14DRAFT_429523, partial [Mycena pura]